MIQIKSRVHNRKESTDYILIAAAVLNELAWLLNKIDRPVASTVGRRRVIFGYINERPVKLLVTGPGIINTVQALSAVIEKFRPALIIQTGSAGLFAGFNLNVGDVGIATEEISPELGIESENGALPLGELPFPLFKVDDFEVKNRYPLDVQLTDLAFGRLTEGCRAKGMGLKKGTFITVSTITATNNRADELYNCFKPCMENMEGAGAAHLSIYYGIPFLEIRCASNIVGARDKTAWNLPLACERCAWAVYELICNLNGYTF